MSRVVAPRAALGAALVSGLAGVLACAPEISPAWKIDGVRDLAAQIAVTQRGPLGDPLPDDPARPLHEALPLDTVRITPFIVDADGPVPTEDLELHWVACDSIACTRSLLDFDTLPSCDGMLEFRGNGDACAAGTGPTAQVTLGLPEVEVGELSVSEFLPSAAMVGIGSVRNAPGASECLRRLEDRTALGECFVLHQNIVVGPLGDLIEFFEMEGLTIETEDIPESILLRPRNRTPAVERFSVEGLGNGPPLVADEGSTLRAAPGSTLTVSYVPDDLDLEAFDVIASDGTPLSGSDFLQGRWFSTGDHESFETLPQLSQVTLTLNPFEETSYLYILVRDSAGSINVGSLRLEARNDP